MAEAVSNETKMDLSHSVTPKCWPDGLKVELNFTNIEDIDTFQR